MITNNRKKLSTGIAGLDALFYGGIHTHKGEEGQKGILMMARGQHGVNKIHLAMQICEGLFDASTRNDINEIRRDIIRRNKFAISYSIIKKNSFNSKNKRIEDFNKIIKECNDNEKTEWENRKKQCDNDYEGWIIKYAPKLLKIKDNLTTEELKEILIKYNFNSDNSPETSVEDWIDIYVDMYSELSNEYKYHVESSLKKLFDNDQKKSPKILFISLNKDENLLKNLYYDFYIQRLIRDIRMDIDPNRVVKSLFLLHSMLWTDIDVEDNIKVLRDAYEFPSIKGRIPSADSIKQFRKDIQTGFIYYNGRTHGLHVRHQKGAEDTGDMLLCNLGIPDDYTVRIIGRDTLNDGDSSVDGLTTFQKMMRELDKYRNKNAKDSSTRGKCDVDFIMIDGLSRLNKNELAQCPLNALSDKLRSKSTAAIITVDEKLYPSEISTDIVLDMDIKSDRMDHQHTALKISKCLYQKNAYGWHRYKMRNAGIEVIPSIHLQMGQRFIMDDIVSDATLPIHRYPYPFWLNENEEIYEDTQIVDARDDYDNPAIHVLKSTGLLEGYLLEGNTFHIFFRNMLSKLSSHHHVIFVNLDKNRADFYNDHIKDNISYKNSKWKDNIHLFNFPAGYCHTDEILWALDQQIKAIEKKARIGSRGEMLETHYSHVNLVLGDLNHIHYAHPCLSTEPLFLPALAMYTKKHHMTNYVYATVNQGFGIENTELHKKEVETIMQMRKMTKPFKELIKN